MSEKLGRVFAILGVLCILVAWVINALKPGCIITIAVALTGIFFIWIYTKSD